MNIISYIQIYNFHILPRFTFFTGRVDVCVNNYKLHGIINRARGFFFYKCSRISRNTRIRIDLKLL